MTEKPLSFYGDPDKKAARIARAKQHVEADRLVSGLYTDEGNHSIGCSVGCDLIDIYGWGRAHEINESSESNHEHVATHDGTPVWLEHLRDSIFEGLPKEKRHWWHVALAEAIPIGVDLQRHMHLVFVAILDIAHRQCGDFEECSKAVDDIRYLHKRSAQGQIITEGEWEEAAREAAAAAAWAARAAARWETKVAAAAVAAAVAAAAEAAARWETKVAAAAVAAAVAAAAEEAAAWAAKEAAAREAAAEAEAWVEIAEAVVRILSSEGQSPSTS